MLLFDTSLVSDKDLHTILPPSIDDLFLWLNPGVILDLFPWGVKEKLPRERGNGVLFAAADNDDWEELQADDDVAAKFPGVIIGIMLSEEESNTLVSSARHIIL